MLQKSQNSDQYVQKFSVQVIISMKGIYLKISLLLVANVFNNF